MTWTYQLKRRHRRTESMTSVHIICWQISISTELSACIHRITIKPAVKAGAASIIHLRSRHTLNPPLTLIPIVCHFNVPVCASCLPNSPRPMENCWRSRYEFMHFHRVIDCPLSLLADSASSWPAFKETNKNNNNNNSSHFCSVISHRQRWAHRASQSNKTLTCT